MQAASHSRNVAYKIATPSTNRVSITTRMAKYKLKDGGHSMMVCSTRSVTGFRLDIAFTGELEDPR